MCVIVYMGYRPYCDVTLYPAFDITSVAQVDHFTLGFVVSDADKNPSWGGYYPIENSYYSDQIESLRKKGGDVIVSFGGAMGQELATVSSSSLELFQKYAKVVRKYDLTSLDFDIEGSAIHDDRANKYRAGAIRELKRVFPRIKISLTVPTTPDGLDASALRLIDQTPCDLVNIMAMDYGNGKGKMAEFAISAAKSAFKQTGKSIGITVMIGVNDTGEVFTLDDAKKLKAFIKRNSWVKRTSIWSINRDNGKKTSMSHSSMIDQYPFQFSEILK